MVKQEIKGFKTEYGEYFAENCNIPLSLRSLGVDKIAPERELRMSARVYIDHMTSTYKHVYIKISEAVGAYTVSVNGNPIGSSDGTREACFFDAKAALSQGDNDIVITFESATLGSGIFGKAEILKFNGAVIDNISVTQRHEGGTVSILLKMETVGSSEGVRAVATLVSGAGQIYYGGINRGRGTIIVRDPLYWWPKGQGVQNIYKLTVNLYGEMEIEDTLEMQVGLRTVTTVNSADGGLVDVNGARFVPMGCVYAPVERASDAVDEKRLIDAQVTSMARAGVNTAVIPNGSPRICDYFYKLCDAHGIVVIHEVSEIDASVRDLIMRKSHHASFGMIDFVGCGDNIDEQTELLREINPDLEFALYEGGASYGSALSLPGEATITSRIPEDERNLFSETLEIEGREKILKLIADVSEGYPYASCLSDFAYASQLAAADSLADKMIRARLLHGDGGRAVFSGISVDSSLISNSVMDSSVAWKAPLYSAARFFTPLAVFASVTDGGVAFSVSNESKRSFVGKIEYKILDNENNLVFSETRDCEVDKFASKRLFIRDLSEYISGHEREYYLEYYLLDGSSVLSRNTLLFCTPKRFRFCDPKIKFEIAGDERRFGVTLTAEAFAKAVEISFEGADAFLYDNYIDITSPSPVKVSFGLMSGYETVKSLSAKIKIRSVYDIGK